MANEEGAVQGIDAILDNIPDETPAVETTEQVVEETTPLETPAETTETPAAETVAEKEPAESLEEVESQVAKLFPKTTVDHSGKTVPLEKHTALRTRAQNAETELEALKAKQADVDTSALNELVDLVSGDDDDEVDMATLKQVVEKLPSAINSIAQANINKVVETANTQNLMAKIKTDETAFRKDHADYDKVTDFALDRNLVSDDERRKVFASPNAAEAMYKLASEKIATERELLGITAPSTAQTTTENQPAGQTATVGGDVPLSDEEGFKAFLDPNS